MILNSFLEISEFNRTYYIKIFLIGLFSSFLVALAIMPGVVTGQNEANIWYFGSRAGLDFNNGAPTALTDGVLNTNEGCATISDNNGALLFYTDGITVWDRTHARMQNGADLSGNSSSTQSAVVILKPGSISTYLIFTVDERVGPKGLRYSEVDMTMNGGLGAVNSVKNVLVRLRTCEKIAVVTHANGIDFWIVTHLFDSDEFHSYLLTSAGLNTSPIISAIGTVVGGFPNSSIGYLKASSDGSRLAAAHDFMGVCSVFDFDNNNGTISNEITLETSPNSMPYGVEFSPDNTLLYVSYERSHNNLAQFNLLAGTPNDIRNSIQIIWNGSLNGGALQLGPDQKIYHSQPSHDHISVINNPNGIGPACNYVSNGVFLEGRSARFGLPTFYNSITLNADFTFEFTCVGDSTCFSPRLRNIDSVAWSFDDISSGLGNKSVDLNPKHVFSDTGSFHVVLLAYLDGNVDSSTTVVKIQSLPLIDLGNDTSICAGDAIILRPGEDINYTYSWQDLSVDSFIIADSSGLYWVEATNSNGCVIRDSIVVNNHNLPLVSIKYDSMPCIGDIIKLQTNQPSFNHTWSTGITDTLIEASHNGLYSVVVIDSNGCKAYDTINLVFNSLPEVNLGEDTTSCEGDSIRLYAPNSNQILWSTGDTSSSILVQSSNVLWLEVTDAFGCKSSDSILVEYHPLPVFDLTTDTILCDGDTTTIRPDISALSYQWSTGATTMNIDVVQTGQYWLKLNNNENCQFRDSINIVFHAPPEINLGNDTSICELVNITLDATNLSSTYLWSTGESSSTILIGNSGEYFVEVTNEFNCLSTDTIEITEEYVPEIDLGVDTLLCDNDVLILDVSSTGDDYLWQDNSIDETFEVETTGVFYVMVSNKCGTSTDSISISYLNCNCEVFAPSAFSPNNDGVNDKYFPLSDCDFIFYYLEIFDRWGEKVFESNDNLTGWDGVIFDKEASEAVYVYVLTYQFPTQNQKIQHGHITLVR